MLSTHAINNKIQDTRAGLPNFWGGLRCLSPFHYPLATPYRGTILAVGGLVLRAGECVSPAGAVLIRILVT